MATIRYIQQDDKDRKGWGHAQVNHDLLITGGGNLFLRTDDLAATPRDPNANMGAGKDIELLADQKIFFDGRFSYESIDTNWFGKDAIADTSGTDPVIFTNIGGQAKIQRLSINGIKNALITGKFDPVAGTGHVNYLGHDALPVFQNSLGNYGIWVKNTNPDALSFTLLRDQYGNFRKSCSDIEVNYVEVTGGIAGIQMKADFISDDGYDHNRVQEGSTTSSGNIDEDVRYAVTSSGGTGYVTYNGADYGPSKAADSFTGVNGVTTYTVSGDAEVYKIIKGGEQTYEDSPTNSIKSSGTMRNMKVNNCYIHDINGEAIYAGHTGATGDQHHSIELIFENNRCLRLGREGTQIGRLMKGSKIRNNIIMNGGSNWLREKPHGGTNFQDKGFQIGCRNGGIEVAHNIIGGGASDTVIWQMDGSGDIRTGDYAWIGTDNDKSTHVWFHDNYLIGSRNNAVYCQAASTMTGVTNSYATWEDNFFDKIDWEYDALDGSATTQLGLVSGNNTVTYIDFIDNTKKQNDRTLTTAFSPVTLLLTETGTTTDTNMAVPLFINSGWDDANREYLRFEHWVYEVGAFGPGGGTQSGVKRDFKLGDIVTVHDGYFYKCISAHESATDKEPGVGASWATVWERIPEFREDDVRLVRGSVYHNLGIGLSTDYDAVPTTNPSLKGDPNINLVV